MCGQSLNFGSHTQHEHTHTSLY